MTFGLDAGNASSIAARASRTCRCSTRCIAWRITLTAREWSRHFASTRRRGWYRCQGRSTTPRSTNCRKRSRAPASNGCCARWRMRSSSYALRRPVVLAFEDLHWSDPSTITLFDLLARRTEHARLLIVGTHRPLAILPSEHPLRILVPELAGRCCEELSLPPLTPNEVAEYLENRIEREPTETTSLDQLARSIHQRTEGNPLYMVTLVGAHARQ